MAVGRSGVCAADPATTNPRTQRADTDALSLIRLKVYLHIKHTTRRLPSFSSPSPPLLDLWCRSPAGASTAAHTPRTGAPLSRQATSFGVRVVRAYRLSTPFLYRAQPLSCRHGGESRSCLVRPLAPSCAMSAWPPLERLSRVTGVLNSIAGASLGPLAAAEMREAHPQTLLRHRCAGAPGRCPTARQRQRGSVGASRGHY